MPRGVKQEPSAPAATEAPSKGEAASKGTKGAKAKPTLLSVSKAPLKKKDAQKDGQKPTTSSGEGGIDIAELEKKRKELSDQLRKCEVQIHRLESQYFDTANPLGNALKGYDGLLSASAASSAKRLPFRGQDRIFSGSSTSGSIGRDAS
ncbi:hypothetical protein Agub_g14282 [Astrephomene gubernaculifera]|uniref:Chromatin modification-related protein EAF6 n=1 Tax=Astrephomene gubernaculifera TaxID=47775 RepID=A0AAD3E182_9CHLO|nr:hypothetical protein Agub_g14282 [Astrephomene gubernaculifera]